MSRGRGRNPDFLPGHKPFGVGVAGDICHADELKLSCTFTVCVSTCVTFFFWLSIEQYNMDGVQNVLFDKTLLKQMMYLCFAGTVLHEVIVTQFK